MRRALRIVALVTLALAALPAQAADAIRIGVLKFGTVSWELDTIRANGFDEKHGVALEVQAFAGEDAASIAFRAGAVDMIVTDWIEVARRRAEGEAISFAPYSTSIGAIMVPEASPLASIADLRDQRIGVTGGPLDKAWLLIQGAAAKNGLDIAGENDVVYGAPPLIAEKLRQGEFDAALNYWQFNARLEAGGFRVLTGGGDAARALGAEGPTSVLGYVFRQDWADEHRDKVLAFLAASRDAKALLAESNAEWTRLSQAGIVRETGGQLEKVRERFRDGIPRRAVAEEQADAARLFTVLAELGGRDLVGDATALPGGTFWPALLAPADASSDAD